MRIKDRGFLDRSVRHLTSEWGWPGAVFVLGGLFAFVVAPSTDWLDYRGFSDEYEQVTALGVVAFGLVWIFAAAAYYRMSARVGRKPKSRS